MLEAEFVASHIAWNELAFGADDPGEELAGTFGFPVQCYGMRGRFVDAQITADCGATGPRLR